MHQPIEPGISVKVFISYTHEDQELRKKLEEHLSLWKYAGKISIWQDQGMPAGANWEDRINTHLDEANMILNRYPDSFQTRSLKHCWVFSRTRKRSLWMQHHLPHLSI